MTAEKGPKPRFAWRARALWTAMTIIAFLAIVAPGGADPRMPKAPSTVYYDALSAVAATSATNAWAVGGYSGKASSGLIEHWNGSSWKIQKSPDVGGLYLYGLAAPSADVAWAVGSVGYRGLIENWNGHSWERQPSARPPAGRHFLLNAVTATSASNAWAVGAIYIHRPTGPQREAFIEHWDGSSWSQQAGPAVGKNSIYLEGVSATSSKNAWAVGQLYYAANGKSNPIVLHWHDGKWSIQTSQNDGASYANQLAAVSAASSTAAFAVGTVSSQQSSGQNTLIETVGEGYWHLMASPNGTDAYNLLNGVSATSASNAWAVGETETGPEGAEQTLVAHFNGNSPWAIQSSPKVKGELRGVGATSAKNAWAVGLANKTGASTHTLIEHWNGSSWKVAPSPNQ